MVDLGRRQARSDAVVNSGGGHVPRLSPEVRDVAAELEGIARTSGLGAAVLGAHEIRRLRAANALLLALLAEGAELWPIDEDWVYRVRTAQRELAAMGLQARLPVEARRAETGSGGGGG